MSVPAGSAITTAISVAAPTSQSVTWIWSATCGPIRAFETYERPGSPVSMPPTQSRYCVDQRSVQPELRRQPSDRLLGRVDAERDPCRVAGQRRKEREHEHRRHRKARHEHAGSDEHPQQHVRLPRAMIVRSSASPIAFSGRPVMSASATIRFGSRKSQSAAASSLIDPRHLLHERHLLLGRAGVGLRRGDLGPRGCRSPGSTRGCRRSAGCRAARRARRSTCRSRAAVAVEHLRQPLGRELQRVDLDRDPDVLELAGHDLPARRRVREARQPQAQREVGLAGRLEQRGRLVRVVRRDVGEVLVPGIGGRHVAADQLDRDPPSRCPAAPGDRSRAGWPAGPGCPGTARCGG